MSPRPDTTAERYRATRDDARRIAADPCERPEMRRAALEVAATNDALLAGCATVAAHEGRRLPRGVSRVAW